MTCETAEIALLRGSDDPAQKADKKQADPLLRDKDLYSFSEASSDGSRVTPV